MVKLLDLCYIVPSRVHVHQSNVVLCIDEHKLQLLLDYQQVRVLTMEHS